MPTWAAAPPSERGGRAARFAHAAHLVLSRHGLHRLPGLFRGRRRARRSRAPRRRRAGDGRVRRARLFHAGLHQLAGRGPAAQYLHRLARRGISCGCCSTNWPTRWCMPTATRRSTNPSPRRWSGSAWPAGSPSGPRRRPGPNTRWARNGAPRSGAWPAPRASGWRTCTHGKRASPGCRNTSARRWNSFEPGTPGCVPAGWRRARSPRRSRDTTAGWPKPTTRPSGRRPPMTNSCPPSRRCSNARGASGRGSTGPCAGWPRCRRTSGCGSCAPRCRRPGSRPPAGRGLKQGCRRAAAAGGQLRDSIRSMYCCFAASPSVPLSLVQASHLARPTTSEKLGRASALSPAVACL